MSSVVSMHARHLTAAPAEPGARERASKRRGKKNRAKLPHVHGALGGAWGKKDGKGERKRVKITAGRKRIDRDADAHRETGSGNKIHGRA